MSEKSTEQEKRVIAELCQLVNLTWYMGEIGKRTRYGQRAGPTPWHYTNRLLPENDYSASEVLSIIALFYQLGAANEVQVAEWIVSHADDIPDQDGEGG